MNNKETPFKADKSLKRFKFYFAWNSGLSGTWILFDNTKCIEENVFIRRTDGDRG